MTNQKYIVKNQINEDEKKIRIMDDMQNSNSLSDLLLCMKYRMLDCNSSLLNDV